MPYEVSFTKLVPQLARDEYINECCVGGDAVVNHLLPVLKPHYASLDTNQEDWGWFIWIDQDGKRLAVDVFTDDPDRGEFRIHLTSSTPRWLRRELIADTPELEVLRERVVSALSGWTDTPVTVEHIDPD